VVAEIRRKTIKQGERNVVTRFFHAASDKETIAGWRSDLNRIFLVFNVRFVVFVWSLLTINSQTELAINTQPTPWFPLCAGAYSRIRKGPTANIGQ